MFERFTHPAREAVVQAQFLGRELRQSQIGTEHVLLALLADPAGPIATAPALTDKGVDAGYVRTEILRRVSTPGTDGPAAGGETDAEDREALKAIGIDLDAVRRAIEQNFGPGALQLPREKATDQPGPLRRLFQGSGRIPFSKRSKKVLELSLREALRLKHNYIAPEHIMLGLLREGEGLAAQILAGRGVDFDELRADVTRSLNSEAA
jgi:ATP-dependent Clp protease ATP-binding subunit ClpA